MPADISPTSLRHDPSRAETFDAVLKSKGINNIDDIEDDSEPLLTLQNHHELVVVVEMCPAQRPSASLKGTHERYEQEFARLNDSLQDLQGEGSMSFHEWAPGLGGQVDAGASLASRPTRPTRPQSAGTSRASSRPQSAMSSMRRGNSMAGASERLQPRVGAFEVSFKLINTVSHESYGPVQIFSKIATGHWPGQPRKLIKRAQEYLQPFLAKDMGSGLMFAHVRSEVAKERESSPLRSGMEHGEPPSSPSSASTPSGAAPDASPLPSSSTAAAASAPPTGSDVELVHTEEGSAGPADSSGTPGGAAIESGGGHAADDALIAAQSPIAITAPATADLTNSVTAADSPAAVTNSVTAADAPAAVSDAAS